MKKLNSSNNSKLNPLNFIVPFVIVIIVSLIISNVDAQTYNVTIGSEFEISADNVTGITSFEKKPKVYTTNDDGKKKSAKVTTKTYETSTVTCVWKKKTSSGKYTLWVKPKVSGEKLDPIQVSTDFNIKDPEITGTGLSGNAEDTVTLDGNFFGTKKPKVWLTYSDEWGGERKLKCKVITKTNIMNVTTGVSQIKFIVHKKLPEDQECTLYLKNKIGETTASFNAGYTLTVNNGTGGGDYSEGDNISISANAPTAGQAFDQWTGDTDYLASTTNSSTTVTMPAKNIVVTATYKDPVAGAYTLTVNNGTGGGSYAAGQIIGISADAPAEGKTFDQWTGDTGYLASTTSSSTSVTMPEQNIAVTATYKESTGSTYYVDGTNGDDSNDGSEANPWKTIQKAANTLVAGDTVNIKAGTYNERVTPQNSGTADQYITYSANSGDTVTIDGTGVSVAKDSGLFDVSGRSYIKISGLRVINSSDAGIYGDTSTYITVEKNYTENTVSSGIGFWSSDNITIDTNEVNLACNDGEQECITIATTSNFVVRNNTVHDNGPGTIGGEGIDLKDGSHDGVVYKNTVYDLNNRLGIYIEAWDKETYNIDVYQNIVYNINGADGFACSSERGGRLHHVKVYNNIVYNCSNYGMSISRNDGKNSPIEDISFINNTIYKNGIYNGTVGEWGGAIFIEAQIAIKNITIRNNICNQNEFFQIALESGVDSSQITVDHNLIYPFNGFDGEIRGDDYVEADPLFTNASSFDFTLQSTSPAIDAGSSTGAPTDDYAGNPRGSSIDIGAYEYIP